MLACEHICIFVLTNPTSTLYSKFYVFNTNVNAISIFHIHNRNLTLACKHRNRFSLNYLKPRSPQFWFFHFYSLSFKNSRKNLNNPLSLSAPQLWYIWKYFWSYIFRLVLLYPSGMVYCLVPILLLSNAKNSMCLVCFIVQHLDGNQKMWGFS